MKRLVPVLFLFLMASGSQLYSQTTSSAPLETQKLLVRDYKTLPILFEHLDPNSFGLTESSIRTKTELRLREAAIKPSELDSNIDKYYLYVHVDTNGAALNINLQFCRRAVWSLPDDKQSLPLFATVWNAGSFGIGNSATTVLSALDNLIDKFLNAYLKANQ